MKLAIRFYSYILLAYTGWRTYDFMSHQLPDVLGNLKFWLSIIFLFTTEIGLILWHEASLKHVTTHEQNTLTRVMVGTDLIGSLTAGIADMILNQTLVEGYKISPLLADFLIYGLPIIVCLNVVAAILFENYDAELQEEKAEKAVEFEIHKEAMKQIKKQKKVLAAQKKNQIIDEIIGNVTGRIDEQYGDGKSVSLPEPSIIEKVTDGVENTVEKLGKALKRGRGRPRKSQIVFASETDKTENPTLPG